MPVYRIESTPAAYRQIRMLPLKARRRIAAKIDSLASDPHPAGCVKLKQTRNIYRIRSGDYRILYEVKDEILLVLIVKVAHRREVYKRPSNE